MIELLVVIAIIAILSIVVILTLNPAALMQQGRDSTRVSDMSTLNSAISIYLSAGGTGIGNSNTVYVSIPDPTATSTAGDQCQGLGLPTLPSTYSYHCAATSTVRNVDSTGWIPINFGNVAIGSSLSQLPLDPTNQSSSRLYYTYTTNGTQFEVTAPMESAKYQVGGSNDVISGDGGTLASVYEKGSKLGLEPLDYGDSSLVGYWPLTEGTGSIAYDDSGNNASGTWGGTQTGSSGYYSAGKGGGYQYAGAFNGINNCISVNTPSGIFANTVSAWIYTTLATSSPQEIIDGGSNNYRFYVSGGQLCLTGYPCNVGNISTNTWTYATEVKDGTTNWIYINGNLVGSASGSVSSSTAGALLGSANCGGYQEFYGLIDGVRLYNRALSAAQIAAMYAGGK